MFRPVKTKILFLNCEGKSLFPQWLDDCLANLRPGWMCCLSLGPGFHALLFVFDASNYDHQMSNENCSACLDTVLLLIKTPTVRKLVRSPCVCVRVGFFKWTKAQKTALNSISDWHFYQYLYVTKNFQNTAKFNQEMDTDQHLSSVAIDPSRLALCVCSSCGSFFVSTIRFFFSSNVVSLELCSLTETLLSSVFVNTAALHSV